MEESTKNFLVYKSSAGSGKTFTLVKEYLLIALNSNNHERYKNILAITFTNKAAAEMKARVTKYLKGFCNASALKGGEAFLFNTIADELGIETEKLQQRSFKMLQSILHNYSDFNITTIDKFILKIIRSFAFDLQLPYNFEVELDSKVILNQAINNLIAETGKDAKLTAFLVNYVKELADEDESWNIQNGLLNVADLAIGEDAYRHTQLLSKFSLEDFVRIRTKIGEETRAYENDIQSKIKAGKEIWDGLHIDINILKGKSKSNIAAYFTPNFSKNDYLIKQTSDTAIKNITNDEWCSTGNEGSFPVEAQQKLFALYQDIETIKSERLGNYILKKNIFKNLFQVGLLNEIDRQIQIIREEQNFIHISEFNKRVAEVVIEQPIPFIYERIGEKFDNYLIDEFQDTSLLQWQNLLPLVENSLAYNNKSLIVGDAKQAIYRWRGGDVEQFVNLPEAPQFADNEIIQERITTLRRQYNGQTLTANYRSTKEIIEFNNLFFETLTNNLPDFFTTYYNDVKQDIGSDANGGYAEVKVFQPNDEYKSDTLVHILNTINNCKQRGKSLNEIAILSRTNGELTIIAEFLSLHNIPVFSSESLNLSQSPEVSFLMGCFQMMQNSDNLDAIITVANYLNKINPIDFFEIFKARDHSFEALIGHIKIQYNITLPEINGFSIYECFEELISVFKIAKNTPYIQTFLDVVRKQSADQNVMNFIEFWVEKKEKLSIASPEDIDAVTLITIHKSKGLEFPIVMLPFANKPSRKNNFLWVSNKEGKTDLSLPSALLSKNKTVLETELAGDVEDEELKEILDELNVVYVALTRAVDELYISIQDFKKTPDSIKGCQHFYHPILKELNTQNDGVYSYGKQSSSTAKEVVKSVNKEELAINSSNWREKIKISFSAPTIWDVPKDSSENFLKSDPRKYGNLMHTAFAYLNADADFENALNALESKGMLAVNEREHIKTLLKSTLQLSPLNSIWRDGKHIIEKEIITPDGASYRPDRIIEYKTVTYLIDFKTGKHKKKDEKQIHYYEKLLKSLGFKTVQSYLLYTENGESIKL